MLPDYRTHTRSNIANLLKKSRNFSMEYFTILKSEDLECSENKNSNSFKSMIMLFKTYPKLEKVGTKALMILRALFVCFAEQKYQLQRLDIVV